MILWFLFIYSPVECGNIVKQMVHHRIFTKQTPPEGVEVQKVCIECLYNKNFSFDKSAIF